MEPQLLQGDDSELRAVLRFLCAHAAAAALPERELRGDEGRHRAGALGLHHHGAAVAAVQRLFRRHVPAQDGAHGVLHGLRHLLRRLSGGVHAANVHHRADAPRGSLRVAHRGQRHDGHRRAALVTAHRGHRLLRAEQQPGHGHRAYHRHLPL